MTDPTLLVRLDRSDSDRPSLRAPAVGRWSDPPRPGTVLGPGSAVGRLHCLHRRYLLVMPEGAAGTVEREASLRDTAVGFGDLLFRLQPLSGEAAAGASSVTTGGDETGRDLPEGGHAVCAPTDGVFYRKPSPEAPPFVEVGGRVRTGEAVGLVEVMKTFNQIVYGGAALPDEAEVVEIRCEDGAEVSAGQTLIVVR